MNYVVATQFEQSVQQAFEKLGSQTVADHSNALSFDKIILAGQKMGQHFSGHFSVCTSVHEFGMARAHHVLCGTHQCRKFYPFYKLTYRL